MRARRLIQELVPNCRIGVGHGQMDEKELERVLLGFMRHEYDVFVCTTIVENGLDIPLANTIIIENAERYGLSELYQLRGRVGRSNRRAYAYLLVPGDTELSEIARKRLAALREFSDLGAGFKIAALDLELRGAGNLLGGEQHGHIAAVGFDTYLRLLEETVQELKGEERPLEVHSSLNLGLDIRIPPEYIADEHQRLRAYKRIADARDAEQAEQVRAELGRSLRPAAGGCGDAGAIRAAEDPGARAGGRGGRPPRRDFAYQVPSGLEDRTDEADGAGVLPCGGAVHSRRRAAASAPRTGGEAERGVGVCEGGAGCSGPSRRRLASCKPLRDRRGSERTHCRCNNMPSRFAGSSTPIDIGKRSPAFPVTPPYVRVRIRRFGGLSYQRTVNLGIPSESK